MSNVLVILSVILYFGAIVTFLVLLLLWFRRKDKRDIEFQKEVLDYLRNGK